MRGAHQVLFFRHEAPLCHLTTLGKKKIAVKFVMLECNAGSGAARQEKFQ